MLRLPNGSVATRFSLQQRLARLLTNEARALTGSIAPAANVQVTLVRLLGDGTRQATQSVAVTDSDGNFSIALPSGTDVDTCRFLIEAGGTEAFVYTALANDIDFASDAAVQLILQKVAQGADLCRYSARDIGTIVRRRPQRARHGERERCERRSIAPQWRLPTPMQGCKPL